VEYTRHVPEAQPKRDATSPGEMLLAGVSLACWLAAVPFVIASELGSYSPQLRAMAEISEPVLGFALPLAVGSLTLLLLRRPARSAAWRGFQHLMLTLAAAGLTRALCRYVL
jgi:hypothetical protein